MGVIDFLFGAALLPLIVLVAWPLLWWRGTRRSRLGFAVVAPVVLVLLMGVSSDVIGQTRDEMCGFDGCRGDVQSSLAVIDSTSWMGTPLWVNCLVALVVGAPVAGLTLLVDLMTWSSDRKAEADRP